MSEFDGLWETIAELQDLPIGICAGCGQPLPLRKARPGEQPLGWVCLGCGAESSAVLDTECLAEGLSRVRPTRLSIDRSKVVPVAKVVAETASSLARFPDRRSYQRAATRHSCATSVIAVPVDRGLRPLDDPILMMARDVSTHGICLIHAWSLNTDLLILEMPGEGRQGVQLLGEVVRHRVLAFCHEYGVKFLARMGD